MMKVFLSVAAVTALVARPALAADMAVKVPPPPSPAAWNWTGPYLGIEGGYGFASDPFNQVATLGGGPTFQRQRTIVAPKGALFGGEAGYNWQTGNIVVGIEADAQWTGQRNTACDPNTGCITVPSIPILLQTAVSQKIDWLATARGRLGWANDGYLIYATGGAAFGKVEETDSLAVVGGGLAGAFANTSSQTRGGWTLGGGIEARLWGNWTGKFEYLHVDLGSMTSILNVPLVAPGGNIATTSSIRDNIVRLGLNYQFNAMPGPAAPASAATLPVKAPVLKAPPAAPWDWTGPYLGINGGYSVGSDPFNQAVIFGGVTAFQNVTANAAPKGGLFGGQAGYNWQVGGAVLGVEGDAQWTGQRDTECGATFVPCQTGQPTAQIVSQKIDWLATARGRLGWAHDGYLFYATGGAAWGRVMETDSVIAGGAALTGTLSQTRTGWTAGGGIEARLAGNWTGKLEYLHVDLGSLTNALGVAPAFLITTTTTIRDDVIRAGLNYKFEVGPVAMK
jgi:outer membrane immunogenic protein